ncbi:sigma factor-like helix-turn-helix DNA-binding protein [Aquamicrobium lusatiense]|uniref:sigma factor-like helix-turn-helix DNA-binding protein n=1 Tax=Aquamicrobium lusatiense TaxID=89772 RepID=UPI00313D575C
MIEQALLELPEEARTAFEMYRLGERTINEVAAALGYSASRTWRLIRQAYRHLRLRLNGDDI